MISRSVATDKFSGCELAKMLALIGAINGIAPVAAPIVGGTLTGIIGWRGIFTILLGLGIVLLAGSFRFSESLPATNRSTVEWADILRGFKTTLRNRRYLCYIFQLGFAQGILFANIASSPFYRAAALRVHAFSSSASALRSTPSPSGAQPHSRSGSAAPKTAPAPVVRG